jgi:hypothetical protein
MMGNERGTAGIAAGTGVGDPGDERATPNTGDVAAANAEAATRDDDDARTELVSRNEAERFRSRWTDVQTRFVDGPQGAVEEADALVADLMRHLAQSFSDERSNLERQWSAGDDVSTEDLRVAMTRYRSFFDRLLEA